MPWQQNRAACPIGQSSLKHGGKFEISFLHLVLGNFLGCELRHCKIARNCVSSVSLADMFVVDCQASFFLVSVFSCMTLAAAKHSIDTLMRLREIQDFLSPTVRYWQQWLVPFLDSLVMNSSGPSSPYYGGFVLNSTTRMYNDRFVFNTQPSNKTATILMDFIEVLFEVIYAAKPNTSWETFVSTLLNNMGETCPVGGWLKYDQVP